MSPLDPTESKPNRSRQRRAICPTSDSVTELIEAQTLAARPLRETIAQDEIQSPTEQAGPPQTCELTALQSDRYQRLAELGRGGWGVVDRVVDRQLEREVAVKRILPGSADAPDAEATEATIRFLREAKITSQLQHPGIVPVHELGDDGCNAFYVMKLLDGDTLRSQIRGRHATHVAAPRVAAMGLANANRRSTADLIDRITPLLDRFIDVGNAVAYAHRKGIIHRDLKPANIMAGEFGETVVLDWGLAHRFGSSPDDRISPAPCEPEGTIIGTPAYMSPEQARGKLTEMDPRSDIFSLGVMLYEIVLGRHPYAGCSIDEILERVPASRFLPIRTAQPACPRALAAIIETAMAADPTSRYQSAQDLVDDVRRFLAGDHVSVHRETPIDRVGRWCRRNRGIATTVAASLIVLLVASVVAGWTIHCAHQDEFAARLEAESAHQAALRQLIESREAMDAWMTDITDVLQPLPEMTTLRKELQRQAITRYERLVETPLDFDDDDDGSLSKRIVTLERAKCHSRLGELYAISDERQRAEDQYETAEAMLEELAVARDLSSSAVVRLTSGVRSPTWDATFNHLVRREQIEVFLGLVSCGARPCDVATVTRYRQWLAEHRDQSSDRELLQTSHELAAAR